MTQSTTPTCGYSDLRVSYISFEMSYAVFIKMFIELNTKFAVIREWRVRLRGYNKLTIKMSYASLIDYGLAAFSCLYILRITSNIIKTFNVI